jgi:hypothetical protein
MSTRSASVKYDSGAYRFCRKNVITDTFGQISRYDALIHKLFMRLIFGNIDTDDVGKDFIGNWNNESSRSIYTSQFRVGRKL